MANKRGVSANPRRQFQVSVEVLTHLSRKSAQNAVQNGAENAHLYGQLYSLGTGPPKMPAKHTMMPLRVAQSTFDDSIVWCLLQV